MTIKDLNNFINQKFPHLKVKIPIKIFFGRRVAIDFFGWMYANYQSIYGIHIDNTDILNEVINKFEIEKEYLNRLIRFIMSWSTHCITPIFIMDGVASSLKKQTKDKRREKRIKTQNDVDLLYEEIDKRINGDILEPVEDLVILLKKKMRNLIIIPQEIIQISISFLTAIGLPCLEAKGDAERLCAILCREKIVAGVYSEDIDTLAFGSPIMIKEFTKGETKEKKTLTCIRLDDLLENFKLNYTEFVDFCILSGCDYNINIRGLGTDGSYKQILAHKRIENIDEKYDYSCLIHEECRNEFKIVSSNDLIVKRWVIDEKKVDFFDIIPIQNLEQFDEYELDDSLIYLLRSLGRLMNYNQGGHCVIIEANIIEEKKLSEILPRKKEIKKVTRKKSIK